MTEKDIRSFMDFAWGIEKWLDAADDPDIDDSSTKGDSHKLAYSVLEALAIKAMNIRSKRLGGRELDIASNEVCYEGYKWYMGRNSIPDAPVYISDLSGIFPDASGYYYTGKVKCATVAYASAVMSGNVGEEWMCMSLKLPHKHGYDYDPALYEPGSSLTREKAVELSKGFCNFLKKVIDRVLEYDGVTDDGSEITEEELREIEDDEELLAINAALYARFCRHCETGPEEIADELELFLSENTADVPPALFFQECLLDAYGSGYEGRLLYNVTVYESKTLGYIVKTYREHPEIHSQVLDDYRAIICGGGSWHSYTCLIGDKLFTVTESGTDPGLIESSDAERMYYDEEHVRPLYIACRLIEDKVAEYIREEVARCEKRALQVS